MTPALDMRGITKRFPGVVANDRLDLQVAAGEIHALLGENGAGKSTLMHILYGLLQPDEGEIRLAGTPVRFTSPRDAMAHGIGMVHQHFMLVPTLTVTENIILGQERTHHWPWLNLRRAARRIRHMATQYHLEVDPQALVQDLPVGVRQRVEMLKVLYRQARILILDEPTAVLTPQEITHVFRTLTLLAQEGTAIIFITHKLREVFQIAHRITVLRRGRVVGTLTPAETTTTRLAALMVDETGPSAATGPSQALAAPSVPSGAAVLTVHDLHVHDDRGTAAVAGVSFSLHAGEILGLAGVQGNGQSELVEALAGLRQPLVGHVTLNGVEITHASPRQRLRLGIAHIPEDRHAHGMVESYSIADNLILNTYTQPPFARGMIRQEAAIQARAVDLMRAFDIRAPNPMTQAGHLSGGNQQKMVVARECSRSLTLLLAVQPTRGLDMGATAFVHGHIKQQGAQGCAVLLVSTALEEILALSDRIAVIYRGTLLALVSAQETTREQLGSLLAGVRPDTPA